MVFEHSGSFRSLRSGLTLVAAPFQNLVSWPVDMARWLESSMSSQHNLRMRNATLRSKQMLLQAKLQKLLALEKENAQLKALLQSSTYVSGKTMEAQLIAVDLAPFTQQVLLDKGSHDGVFEGQPVLDANGVMGQVISAGPTTCRVLLVTDSRSAIPVQNNRNGVRAMANGDGYSKTLRLLYVPGTTDFQADDVLVTSGLGQRYPVGYPVGVVSSVKHTVGERFATITVKPVAHLSRSRQMLLVWPKHRVAEKKTVVKHTSIKRFGKWRKDV